MLVLLSNQPKNWQRRLVPKCVSTRPSGSLAIPVLTHLWAQYIHLTYNWYHTDTISCHGWEPQCEQTEFHCSRGNRLYTGGIPLAGRLSGIWIAVKFSHLMGEECVPCPIFACNTLIFDLQLQEIAWKNLSQGSWKVPGGHDSMWWHGQLLVVAN